ncbi:MAG: hypothetical protein IKE64_06650 [Thermoguttaceae bacterium]|nr:hypothetical protein [Thermoguttaceae bacterium]
MNPNFEDGVGSFYRDTNIIALLALAVGLSPEDSPYKASASAIVSAAESASKVQSLADAKTTAADLKASFTEMSGGDLAWTKVADLGPVMKKGLPNITTEIKRLGKNEKTLTRSGNLDKVIGSTATLAVIAQGCRPNVGDTLAPDEDAQWQEFCGRLYDAAMAANRAAVDLKDGSGTFDAFQAAHKEIEATCNTTCHAVFGGSVN